MVLSLPLLPMQPPISNPTDIGDEMPKEPKIAKMDWRALGYWPVYRDGRLVWEKDAKKP